MPKVLNKYKDTPTKNSVYCGRGSPYGNRFVMGVDGDRDEVVRKYIEEKSQDKDFLDMVKRTLKGKDLVCFCAPKKCHADFLLEVANKPS